MKAVKILWMLTITLCLLGTLPAVSYGEDAEGGGGEENNDPAKEGEEDSDGQEAADAAQEAGAETNVADSQVADPQNVATGDEEANKNALLSSKPAPDAPQAFGPDNKPGIMDRVLDLPLKAAKDALGQPSLKEQTLPPKYTPSPSADELFKKMTRRDPVAPITHSSTGKMAPSDVPKKTLPLTPQQRVDMGIPPPGAARQRDYKVLTPGWNR